MTRGLSLVILIGLIGIVVSPFTSNYYAIHPWYRNWVEDKNFLLSDDFPMFEFEFPFWSLPYTSDKIVIEELTTNGSPVVISLYWHYNSENPSATIQNVTEIRDVFLVGTSQEDSMTPVFRITRYSNQSVEASLRLRFWGIYPPGDIISIGPSVFLLLAIPLVYSMYKHWGSRPNARGFAIFFLILISAVLIAPLLEYTYNHGGSPMRHDLVQEVQTYQFQLNASNPSIEFTESTELGDPDTFVRIANFTTNDVLVAITIIPEGDTESVEFQTVTNVSVRLLQFEFPRENLTGFTVQLNRITEDAVVALSVETVRDVWTPWKDPLPYYLSCAAGLALMVIVLVLPQKNKT